MLGGKGGRGRGRWRGGRGGRGTVNPKPYTLEVDP